MDWNNIRGVIFDMDGVLWRGDVPLPGLVEAFAALRQHKIPFALATNNTSKTPSDYVQKLAGVGVNGIHENEVITSGTATTSYMRATYPAGARIHVFGMGALKYLMTAAGFELADEDVQAVVVGAKLDLVYDDLKTATLLIRAGADFIGTNSDPTYPTPDGLQPGTGAMLAAVSTAAGREPDIVVGKPGKPMFEAALREMGTAPEHTLMIGDRLTTDILGGQQAGLKTGLVLTGVTTRAEAETSEIRADGVFDGLAELMADWGL